VSALWLSADGVCGREEYNVPAMWPALFASGTKAAAKVSRKIGEASGAAR